MQRRRFVQMMTFAGAGGLAAREVARHSGETQTAHYHVKGFTCVTCAVGLETLLRQEKGVKWVKATYPEALVTIQYDPAKVNEPALKSLIAELGFTAEPAQQG